MNHRQLRYFVVVAEELNFSRAARRLHISQPPLSMNIKAMETELGISLFERDKRNVSLTKAGVVLLEHARCILSSIDKAAEMTRLAGQGEAGQLILGFTNSAPMNDIFGKLLRTFRYRYPNISIEPRLMSTADQLEALDVGMIDIGFLRPSQWFKPSRNMYLKDLWNDQLDVFFPFDHPFRKAAGPIGLHEMKNERFICFSAHSGCGIHEHIMMLSARAGFRPKMVQEISVAGPILSLVNAGGGITILPRCQMYAGIAGVMNRSIDSEDTASTLKIAFRNRMNNALVRNFMDVVNECILAA